MLREQKEIYLKLADESLENVDYILERIRAKKPFKTDKIEALGVLYFLEIYLIPRGEGRDLHIGGYSEIENSISMMASYYKQLDEGDYCGSIVALIDKFKEQVRISKH